MDDTNDATVTRAEEAFRFQLQQLDNISREMSSRGELGDDPSWVQDYVYRLLEVSEALRGLANSREEGNPSHRSYP